MNNDHLRKKSTGNPWRWWRNKPFVTAKTDTGQTVVKIAFWLAVLGKGEEQRGGECAIVPSTKKRKKRAQDGWSAIHDFPSSPLYGQKKKNSYIRYTFARSILSRIFTSLLNHTHFQIGLYCKKKKRFRNASVRIFVEERFLMYHFLVSVFL